MDTKMCLTCLCKPSEAHTINEIILENLKISEVLHHIVPRFLEETEFTLPDRICEKCLEKLIISFKFKKQCLNAVENLHKLWAESALKETCQENFSQPTLETEDVELETNEYKSDDENTMESLPEIKVDLKMSFDEIAIDPLTGIREETRISREDNNKTVETAKDDAEYDKTQGNEKIYKNVSKVAENSPVTSNQCKLCNKVFKQPQGLASHMSKTHLKKHLYQCQKCDKGFSAEEPFIRHCNRHLGIKRFPCDHCDKAFDSTSSLNKHLLCHSKESSYLCTICGKSFYRIDVLKQHMHRHDDEELFECKTCDKSFKCFSDHIKHMKLHKTKNDNNSEIVEAHLSTSNQPTEETDEKHFKCDQCEKEFRSITNLKLHQKIHNTKKPYQCVLCSEAFYKNNDLKNHTRRMHKKTTCEVAENTMDPFNEDKEELEMPLEQILTEFKPENIEDTQITMSNEEIEDKLNLKLEENESGTEKEFTIHLKNVCDNIKDQENKSMTSTEPIQCELCKQVFKNPHGLARHRSSTHFKKHLYQCDQCDRGFSVEEFYIKHRNRHLGIKTFKCNQCDKAFETNSILNQHLISHSKLTPHLCTTCGKSFRRIDGLRQHMLRHGEERPFKCSLCPKSFKCLSDKLNHMIRHDEKRYECNICGSRLSTPESLSQHRMIHTGEKPFKCSHCDKSFISLSNMRCHERIHTGEKPYKCQYCWKSFRQSYDRTKHTNRMHKNETDNTKSDQNETNTEESI